MLPSATLSRLDSSNMIGRNFGLASVSSKSYVAVEEEMLRFPTTDGSVMTYHAGTNAVRSGAGIFIGGYFVGVTEDSLLTENHMPFIKY